VLRSHSFVSPTSVKGKGSVTTSPTVVSVMAGGWSGHRLFGRRRRICVPLWPFARWQPIDVHRQSCVWVLFLGDDSCGFNDALSLVKIGVGVGFGIVLPAMSLELLLVVSKFVRVFSVKLGCTVLSINESPFLSEKKPHTTRGERHAPCGRSGGRRLLRGCHQAGGAKARRHADLSTKKEKRCQASAVADEVVFDETRNRDRRRVDDGEGPA
jgi:hypothetical protein